MITVETEKNIIQSESNENPTYACTGDCKKVWWHDDIIDENKTVLHKLTCKACSGNLTKAIEGYHFKVIDKSTKTDHNLNDTVIAYASLRK